MVAILVGVASLREYQMLMGGEGGLRGTLVSILVGS
jgi:hypothetical protein